MHLQGVYEGVMPTPGGSKGNAGAGASAASSRSAPYRTDSSISSKRGQPPFKVWKPSSGSTSPPTPHQTTLADADQARAAKNRVSSGGAAQSKEAFWRGGTAIPTAEQAAAIAQAGRERIGSSARKRADDRAGSARALGGDSGGSVDEKGSRSLKDASAEQGFGRWLAGGRPMAEWEGSGDSDDEDASSDEGDAEDDLDFLRSRR